MILSIIIAFVMSLTHDGVHMKQMCVFVLVSVPVCASSFHILNFIPLHKLVK